MGKIVNSYWLERTRVGTLGISCFVFNHVCEDSPVTSQEMKSNLRLHHLTFVVFRT